MPACACPHADRGEGRGEGENTAISTSYVPSPLSPPTRGGEIRLFTNASKFKI